MDHMLHENVAPTARAAVGLRAPADDWRGLPEPEVGPLLHAEIDAWRRELYWDVRESWQVIEPARRAGYLPGLVTRDAAGRHTGWTCFFMDRGCLHVMLFVSSGPAATSRLLDLLLASPQAGAASEMTVFVRDAAPGLARALVARGFDVEMYRYLAADLPHAEPAPHAGRGNAPHGSPRPQGEIDATFRDAAARLLGRAYAASPELRVFAPHGTGDEWRDYVGNLLHSRDCGVVLPDATLVAPAPDGDLDGIIVTTRLSRDTGHIAQVAVAPDARGRGLGRQLVAGALRAAVRAGCGRATLLVSAANVRALGVYQSFGFRNRSRFVAARRVSRAG